MKYSFNDYSMGLAEDGSKDVKNVLIVRPGNVGLQGWRKSVSDMCYVLNGGVNKDEALSKSVFVRYPEVGGIYEHYKGGKYRVFSLAKHSETGETMVVYESIHFGGVYVRPLTMWFEQVETEGGLRERFIIVSMTK